MTEKEALIDWLREIAELIRRVFEWFKDIPARIEARFDDLEWKGMLVIGAVLLVVVMHGLWVGRKR